MTSPYKKQGGRPGKSPGEKLKYKVTVKLATEEYYFLKGNSRKAGINRSEYMRRCIRNSSVVQRLTPEQMGYIRTLCGMANNLNQIARKANTAGYRQSAIQYNSLADDIDILIKGIRDDSQNR